MFLVHRRDVVEPVEVGQRLQVTFCVRSAFRYRDEVVRYGDRRAERPRRRANPARVCGSYRRLGRGAFALDLASLCPLLQQHQNAPVIAQRCAGLSSHSTDWQHQVTSDARWASSPLHSDLSFGTHRLSLRPFDLVPWHCRHARDLHRRWDETCGDNVPRSVPCSA